MKFKVALLGGVCLMGVASAATAQQTNDPTVVAMNDAAVQAGPFNASPPAAAPGQVQQTAPDVSTPSAQQLPPATVTVTGTRIVRNGYSAPTPVTVAPVSELLETTPTNIADALDKLPEFSPQFTAQSSSSATTPAGNYLNLRGLGNQRTLVMLDGVRVPGTNATGQVDVNTMPQVLVQRVEVVTGGASAIYGSDAVGGVVNYILDTKFNGLKASAQTGISTYGDAPSNKFTVAFGTHVTDNGHFEISYEHQQSAGLDQTDRGYTNATPGYAGTGTAANPYILYNNLRMATTTAGGYIAGATAAAAASPTAKAALSGLVGQQFTGSGALSSCPAGAVTGSLPTTTAGVTSGGLQVGGCGAYLSGMQLLKPVDADNLFARFDYDVGHGITAYAQVAAGLSQTNYYVAPQTAQSATLYSGNPYLPSNVQSLLAAASTPTTPATLSLSTLPQNLYQMQRTNQWDSDLSGTFGLKGKVWDDRFNWNASYTYGQGITHVETDNNINTSNYYAALDAVPGPNGAPVCYVSTTQYASLYPGCMPLNTLGQGNESAAALAYIMQNTAYSVINKTDDLQASISGTAFNDWAGPVSISANAEYRWATLTETSDAVGSPLLTGLRQTWSGKSAPSTLYLSNTVAPTYGADSVWEVGGETVVPLLKDFPLVENLEFNGALRYTQYSVSGSAITWKAGMNYQPVHDLRFRITESRDIRAPSLYELFQSRNATQVSVTDPALNGSTYSVNEYTQGNASARPEIATSNTLGLVYSPSWLKHFSTSIDYYLISIDNVLSQSIPMGSPSTAITTVINDCLASGGTSAYCQAIPRDPSTGQITAVYNFPINLSETYYRGIDLEASYNFDWADVYKSLVGRTDLRLLMNYQPQAVTITNPGAPGTNAAGSGISRARFTLSTDYSVGPFKATWQVNYTGQHHPGVSQVIPTYFANDIMPAIVTDDLNLSYRFKVDATNLQAFFVVDNIFNQTPNLGPSTPTSIPGGTDPLGPGSITPLGRYFTGGVRVSF